MANVQINDLVFKAAERRAVEGGYSSGDEYISDVVTNDLGEEGETFEHHFTPERLADLKRISAEIEKGGKTYSMAELQTHFENKRKTWLDNRPV